MQTTRHTKEQQQHHITVWRQSQLSRAAYCREHNINYLTFCSWISKGHTKETTTSSFIPIEVKDTVQPVANFATLSFCNRCTLQLHERVEASYLHKLIASCN